MGVSRRRFLFTTGSAGLVLPACATAAAAPAVGPVEAADGVVAKAGAASGSVDPFMGHSPDAIRLNKNENPFGPSPRALEALRGGIEHVHRYVRSAIIRERLGAEHGVSADHIRLGTGSGEVLRALPFAFLEDGGHVVAFRHSYDATPAMAERLGKQVKWIDLKEDLGYDMEAFAKAIDADTRIAYLVNPNNPTGASLHAKEIAALADTIPESTLLVVDEAYVQFLPEGEGSSMDLVTSGRKNVIVTRTFSKVYGLAGLRIGYGVAHPEVVERISRVMITGSNYAAYLGAMAAIDDHEHVERFLAHARACRSFYEGAMKKLGVEVVTGHAPLLLAKFEGRVPEVVAGLEQAGIFVRDGRSWSLPNHVRISYGSEAQNQAVVDALAKLV